VDLDHLLDTIHLIGPARAALETRPITDAELEQVADLLRRHGYDGVKPTWAVTDAALNADGTVRDAQAFALLKQVASR
jgi:hypothetical protein